MFENYHTQNTQSDFGSFGKNHNTYGNKTYGKSEWVQSKRSSFLKSSYSISIVKWGLNYLTKYKKCISYDFQNIQEMENCKICHSFCKIASKIDHSKCKTSWEGKSKMLWKL